MKRLVMILMLLVLAMAAYVPMAQAQVPDTDAKIASAMSAAPMAIAQDGAIWDYPTAEGEDFIVLREGNNGWTCFPDWEATPGNNPQCNDPTWMAFIEAFIMGEEPNVTETTVRPSQTLPTTPPPTQPPPRLAPNGQRAPHAPRPCVPPPTRPTYCPAP
jgi:hypothetical protein